MIEDRPQMGDSFLGPYFCSVPWLCVKQERCSCQWIWNGFIFTHWNSTRGKRTVFTNKPQHVTNQHSFIWPLLLTSSRKRPDINPVSTFFTDRGNKSQSQCFTVCHQAQIFTHPGKLLFEGTNPEHHQQVHEIIVAIPPLQSLFYSSICLHSLPLSRNLTLYAWKTKPIITLLPEPLPNMYLLLFPASVNTNPTGHS